MTIHSPPPQRRPFLTTAPTVWAVVIVALLGLAIGLAVSSKPRTEIGPKSLVATKGGTGDAARTPVELPEYLGPEACAECHRDRAAEFRKTRHFAACREPRVGEMPAGFASGNGHHPSRLPNLEFEMTRTEAGFFQTAIRTTANGRRQMTSRIDLAYGAPPTDEVYFTWREDRLFELPVAWLHPQQEWGTSPFDPDSAGDYSRPLSTRCLECHNTWFEHVPGTVNQYKRDHVILGVTCEKCHGPGRDHVDFHRGHPEERMGREVVHPGRLSRELLMDVCGQCHSNAVKHRGPAFSYRPGRPLEESYRTATSRRREDDHVANQVKYLKESKCFQNSKTMTCITCHDPHKPSHSADEGHSAARSCLTCHQAVDCSDHASLPTDIRGQCVDCHMPVRNKVQVFFNTAQDHYVAPVLAYEHRIGIYPIARQEVLLKWHREQAGEESRLAAAKISDDLATHWVAEAEGMRQEFRHLAAIDAYRQAVRLNPSPAIQAKLSETIAEQVNIDEQWFLASRQIRQQEFSDAAETLEEILKLKPDLAKVHGKLGTVYATLGQRDQAVEHLRAVSQFDPDDAYGEGMLGWMAFLDEDYGTAVEHYRRADEIEPYKAKIHYQWGMALSKLESWDAAAERLRFTLTIDPMHADACLALSHLLSFQGHDEEAKKFAERAAKIAERKKTE